MLKSNFDLRVACHSVLKYMYCTIKYNLNSLIVKQASLSMGCRQLFRTGGGGGGGARQKSCNLAQGGGGYAPSHTKWGSKKNPRGVREQIRVIFINMYYTT